MEAPKKTIVSASPSLNRILQQATQFAQVDASVLILGESGSGKEVIANHIHEHSLRANKVFMKVNCAALPSELLESELFGYEAGAFTGATRTKPGLFEICDGGTIFLDEVGEMRPSLQPKLLHVLQDGAFVRLGGRQRMTTDVRVIAATNIDVSSAIRAKSFREDLYYRLASFVISVPALRERPEDIAVLFDHFVTIYSNQYNLPRPDVSSRLTRALVEYRWPGNVRELENYAKRYSLLRDETALLEDLGSDVPAPRAKVVAIPQQNTQAQDDLKGKIRKMKEVTEAHAIQQALLDTCWNRKKASRILNISYKALLYKIRQYGLDTPSKAATAVEECPAPVSRIRSAAPVQPAATVVRAVGI